MTDIPGTRVSNRSVAEEVRTRALLPVKIFSTSSRRTPAARPEAGAGNVPSAAPGRTVRADCELLDGRERCEVARDACASAIADLTLISTGGTRQPALLLATID